MPPKIYGSTPDRSKRILDTFESRTRSTGVLLEGEKGSGKTLLSTMVSVEASARGMSTLIVSAPYHGTDFNAFIQSIDEPCVVLFDEFEKVYHQDNWQNGLLTLLDGTAVTRKLSILTINDTSKISRLLRNRPGRIFYSIKYGSLEEDFIREYCEDCLRNKEHLDQLYAIVEMFDKFNFDMLKALVEEMNRYNEDPRSALKLLNIKPDYTSMNRYECEYAVKGEKFPAANTDMETVNGHPLSNEDGYSVQFFNVPRIKYRGLEDETIYEVDFETKHLVRADARKGVYEFENGEHRMILTKQKAKKSYWDSFQAL